MIKRILAFISFHFLTLIIDFLLVIPVVLLFYFFGLSKESLWAFIAAIILIIIIAYFFQAQNYLKKKYDAFKDKNKK